MPSEFTSQGFRYTWLENPLPDKRVPLRVPSGRQQGKYPYLPSNLTDELTPVFDAVPLFTTEQAKEESGKLGIKVRPNTAIILTLTKDDWYNGVPNNCTQCVQSQCVLRTVPDASPSVMDKYILI